MTASLTERSPEVGAPERAILEDLLGPPIRVRTLKHKPGRRRTVEARGARGGAIAKLYSSPRASVVANRLRAASSARGPADLPVVPEVLACEPELGMVVLTRVPGTPLREALVADDLGESRRVGASLAAWHRSGRDVRAPSLVSHTGRRELEILRDTAGRAPRDLRDQVLGRLPAEPPGWEHPTLVHRDLYEDQIVLGPRIGLIDLDDVAMGPPELDLGNLFAHMQLLGLRERRSLKRAEAAVLAGYSSSGEQLAGKLLELCRALTLLRLACIHGLPDLLPMADDAASHARR